MYFFLLQQNQQKLDLLFSILIFQEQKTLKIEYTRKQTKERFEKLMTQKPAQWQSQKINKKSNFYTLLGEAG